MNYLSLLAFFTLLNLHGFSQTAQAQSEKDPIPTIQLMQKLEKSKTYKVVYKKEDNIHTSLNYVEEYLLGNTSIKGVQLNEAEQFILIEVGRQTTSRFVMQLLKDASLKVEVPDYAYLKSID